MTLPINTGLFQSDADFNNKKPLNADLSGYAGANLTWNTATKKFDASSVAPAVLPGTFVNVKDAPYNAVGDGVTDDTDAILEAMGDVVSEGGGVVFFPKGIYLCNGSFGASYNAILEIPFLNATSQSAVTLELRGEYNVPWSVATAFDNSFASTLKTTATGTGDDCSFLAASPHFGDGVITYTSMNNVMVVIRNLNFMIGDNPTMNGVYLGGAGWAFMENCFILGGGSEPTHGTTGLWMPNQTNFGMNRVKFVHSAGFDTAMKSGEHLRAEQVQLTLAKRGLVFLESIYPSWGNIQLERVVDGIVFIGYHVVDLLVETEHQSPGWYTASHDIKDPSNYGMGTIRYFVGQGGGGALTTAASVEGGTGLTLIDLCSGNMALNTTYGNAHGAAKITGKGTVPAGGTTGQSLKKLSNADYDVGWA